MIDNTPSIDNQVVLRDKIQKLEEEVDYLTSQFEYLLKKVKTIEYLLKEMI